MSKKNKIKRLTDEQYFAYIAGLKEDAALFDADGEMLVPDAFCREEAEKSQGD